MVDKTVLLQCAMDAAEHGIYVTDPAGTIEMVNPGFCRLTGYTREQLIGKRIAILKSGRMPPDYYDRLWSTIKSAEIWREEIINRRRDGSFYWAYQIITPVTDNHQHIQHYVGIQNDISERRHMEEELRYLSEMDVLTGIANRRKTIEELEREIARAIRHDHPLSLLLVDLDHFKKVNDTFGHETGDAVLRAISSTTEAILRPSDRLGRWGGEEFAIILPETGPEGAQTLANRVLDAIREARAIPDYPITVSIGIASFRNSPGEYDTVDSLVRRADEYLYRAKQAGRDQAYQANKE